MILSVGGLRADGRAWRIATNCLTREGAATMAPDRVPKAVAIS